MSLEEVVAEADGVIDGKLGGGVRIQQGGLINEVFSPRQHRLHRQNLRVDVGAVERRTGLGNKRLRTSCTAPGFLDTRLSYAAIGNTS